MEITIVLFVINRFSYITAQLDSKNSTATGFKVCRASSRLNLVKIITNPLQLTMACTNSIMGIQNNDKFKTI